MSPELSAAAFRRFDQSEDGADGAYCPAQSLIGLRKRERFNSLCIFYACTVGFSHKVEPRSSQQRKGELSRVAGSKKSVQLVSIFREEGRDIQTKEVLRNTDVW